jgi:anti-sigma B factor antagonist
MRLALTGDGYDLIGGAAGGTVLEIRIDPTSDNCTVCHPTGEIDASTVCQFRQSLAELASSHRLIVDMSDVSFIDSAGLGALIGGIRRVRERGGDVAVVCKRPGLARLLGTVGFDRIVFIGETIDQAAAALQTDASPIHSISTP